MRANITYGKLDKILRSLGFTSRMSTDNAPLARMYQHEESGARFTLPAFPENDKVLTYHLVAVIGNLENFGITVPIELGSELQKAG